MELDPLTSYVLGIFVHQCMRADLPPIGTPTVSRDGSHRVVVEHLELSPGRWAAVFVVFSSRFALSDILLGGYLSMFVDGARVCTKNSDYGQPRPAPWVTGTVRYNRVGTYNSVSVIPTVAYDYEDETGMPSRRIFGGVIRGLKLLEGE